MPGDGVLVILCRFSLTLDFHISPPFVLTSFLSVGASLAFETLNSANFSQQGELSAGRVSSVSTLLKTLAFFRNEICAAILHKRAANKFMLVIECVFNNCTSNMYVKLDVSMALLC